METNLTVALNNFIRTHCPKLSGFQIFAGGGGDVFPIGSIAVDNANRSGATNGARRR